MPPGYDAARYVDLMVRPLGPAVGAFAAVPASPAELLAARDPDERECSGTHEMHGRYNVETWPRRAGDDLANHMDQIRSVRSGRGRE